MALTKNSTVLFADIADSAALYETAGDLSATHAVRQCVETMRQMAESVGGRVVKTIGDEVMAIFPTPDAAATAAVRMHTTVESLPPVAQQKLALRIGFHAGPVIHHENDVFGDTVNLAARLVAQAAKGKILTSEETATMLDPAIQHWTRRLYPMQLKDKSGQLGLYELVWSQSPDLTNLAKSAPTIRSSPLKLRLTYRGQVMHGTQARSAVTIGRGRGCGLVVDDLWASREHCTIERREDRFVLLDHSANGTYLTIEGEAEIILLREQATLRNRGSIAFGRPRAQSTDFIEYACE